MSQERIWCQAGKHWWMRDRKRGRKPITCPEHQGLGIADANTAQVSEDKLEHDQNELEALLAKVPVVISEYEAAFDKAVNAKGYERKLWDAADAKQNAYNGIQSRIKILRRNVSV